MDTVVRIFSLFLLAFFLTPFDTVKKAVGQIDTPVRQAQFQASDTQVIEMAIMMPHQAEQPATRPYIAPSMSFND